MASIRSVAAILLLAAVPVAAAGQLTAPMRSILEALLDVAPLAINQERFLDPANAAGIERALVQLAESADVIDRHGTAFQPSYDRVRRTLAQDTQQALASFRNGDGQMARFIVGNLSYDCFACHSRLPAGEGSRLSAVAAERLDLETIPQRDHVRILVASRQFEAALRVAEALLADFTIPAAELDRWGVFEDYLKVALRVRGDTARPRAALDLFVVRGDLPVYLQLQISAWRAALLRIDPSAIRGIAAAEALLRQAREENLYLQDRRGLVQATVASGLLHEFVRQPDVDGAERARGYYLLGLAESTISRGLWIPETEYFLELAIRSAPGTVTALDAFAFLEQYLIASYSGSGGLSMPEEVEARLAQLRQLAER